MPLRLIRNNPAFLNEDELMKGFVVRLTDLDLTMETIRENSRESNQHILVIGPRGMGKTMLVLRVAAEIHTDIELSAKWYPLVFGEESYEVATAGEFWLKGIQHLAESTGDDHWQAVCTELSEEKDEKNLNDRALAHLMDFADKQGKRILIIVENLNMLLGEQMRREDGWVLRHTLQNEPRIMLLGTATTRFDEIDNMGKPLFELFRIQTLEPLNLPECVTFWKAATGSDVSDKRIRPIQILTGGNPRLLGIIASFAAGDTFNELMKNLSQMIDEHTSYFKSNIEVLPALERKVFITLASIWEPATARKVAQTARIDVSKTSALLNRLVSRGSVAVVKEGKTQSYQVAERLYNIYYLMRRSTRPSDRVQAVVHFMVDFYKGEALSSKLASICLEACHLEPDIRKYHIIAYKEVLGCIKNEEDKHHIIESTVSEFFNLPDIDADLLKLIDPFKNRAEANKKDIKFVRETRKGDLSQVDSLKKQLGKKPEDPELWTKLARLLDDKLKRYKEAEEAYRKALSFKPDDAWNWALLGWLFHDKLERYPEAEEAYRNAIKIDSNSEWAWAQLGCLLHEKLERFADAEEAYRKSISINSKYHWAWEHLARILHEKLNRYSEAEEAYLKAIKTDPNCSSAWANLGRLLHDKLGRYKEAEDAYRKAINLKPESAWAWAHLGWLLHEKLEQYTESEEAYRKAVSLDPNNHWAWEKLGALLKDKLGRYLEAEEAYRKAIDMDPKCDIAWAHLGELLHEKLERYLEAEEAYRKAVNLDPNNHWAWEQLGDLLKDKLGRYPEAEEAYRKAISIDPNCYTVWANLGSLLHEKLEHFPQAEEAYRNAINFEPKDHWAWAQLGWLLHEKLERYSEAEETYRKAISINPKYHWAWEQLGCLLQDKLKRFPEAEEAYRKAISIQSDCYSAWANLGSLLHEKLERYPEAEEAYRKSISLEPNCEEVWASLGNLLFDKMKRYPEAEEAYRKALDIKPEIEMLKRLCRVQMQRSVAFKTVINTVTKYLNVVGRTAENLNAIAWEIYQSAFKSGYQLAEDLAREALQKAPESPYYQYTLAAILAAQDKWNEALNTASSFLKSAEIGEKSPNNLVTFFSKAASDGFAKEGLEILHNSQCAPLVEPLIVALKMIVGEEYNAPQEVVEVAKDIVEKIESLKVSLDKQTLLK